MAHKLVLPSITPFLSSCFPQNRMVTNRILRSFTRIAPCIPQRTQQRLYQLVVLGCGARRGRDGAGWTSRIPSMQKWPHAPR